MPMWSTQYVLIAPNHIKTIVSPFQNERVFYFHYFSHSSKALITKGFHFFVTTGIAIANGNATKLNTYAFNHFNHRQHYIICPFLSSH